MTKSEIIKVPNIGTTEAVTVIEVVCAPGDVLAPEDPLITLEGDKATVEVPAPQAGVVEVVHVKVGDKVSEGSEILTLKLEAADAGAETQPAPAVESAVLDKMEQGLEQQPAEKTLDEPSPVAAPSLPPETPSDLYAGPGVRRLARTLGVDLSRVPGTGEKSRITMEDVQQYAKQPLAVAERSEPPVIEQRLPAADIDFSQFGAIEVKPLSKIKQVTAKRLSRNWIDIPHVTQFDEADITDLEAFRQEKKALAAQQGLRLTLLAFIMKAVVAALHEFPQFNASLGGTGDQIILKKYFNLGIAVETPTGLVVPVIRDVDKKGLFALAQELAEVSEKARERGLALADMQGGSFTISSLGGIGGTAFTPIINAPEVAILGVSKAVHKPVVQANGKIRPRLQLPLSLSYDHRVIDGAEAARFIVFLSARLADIRTLLF